MTVTRSALGALMALAVGLPATAHATDVIAASGFMSNERLGFQDSRGSLLAVNQDVATKGGWTMNVFALQGTRRHEENELDLNAYYRHGDFHGQASVFFLATRPIYTEALGVEHRLGPLALQADVQRYDGDFSDTVASVGAKYSFAHGISLNAGQSWNSYQQRDAIYFGAAKDFGTKVTVDARGFVNDGGPHAKGLIIELTYHY